MANEAIAATIAAPDDSAATMSDLSTETFHRGVKADLLDALSTIRTSGSFASFRSLGRPLDFGLIIDGIGPISTSHDLHETQAQQLIAKARQAPYGKGSETLVDTSVRNTWELDPDQFTFSGPRWNNYVRTLSAQVALDLGINTTIRFEIYKMLIYERGAMFKPHTDTEKIPGMFGTLVISLPSPHVGGEVVLKHCGEEKVFKTSETEHSYICWYSDVTHEVRPVTSGYRWVLTYNLAIDTAVIPPSAELLRSNARSLRHTLRRWLFHEQQPRKHRVLYHILDHDYTEANIRESSLKARDCAQVHALKQASDNLPFEIFLALLEKEESGGVEHDFGYRGRGRGYYRGGYHEDEDDASEDEGYHHITDVYDSHYRIKTLVDLDGRVVSENVTFQESDLLEESCFDDLEGEEEYEGYMGNSGPQATHWYRITAVVIVPKDSVIGFLKIDQPSQLSHENTQFLLRYCAYRSHHIVASDLDIARVEKLCDERWVQSQSRGISVWGLPRPPFEGETMCEVLKAAIDLGRFDIFERNVSRHNGLLGLDFYTWVRNWVSIPSGDDIDIAQRFASLDKGLSVSVLCHESLSTQFIMVHAITYPNNSIYASPDISNTLPSFHFWACKTLKACLEDRLPKILLSKDGAALCEIIKFFKDPLDFFLTSVLPSIKSRYDVPAFYLAFLSALRRNIDMDTKCFPSEKANPAYKQVARLFISSIKFPALRNQSRMLDQAKIPRSYHDGASVSDQQVVITADEIAVFLSDIFRLGPDGDELMAMFVAEFTAQASQLPSGVFTMWVPVFRQLIVLLVHHEVPLDTPRYQQLFLAFLNALLDNYVRKQPVNNSSLARACVSCSCSDCRLLNNFLSSSTQPIGRFAVNKKRRQHLHQQLDAQRIDCIHETERFGSPQTLVVTKTNNHVAKARHDWKLRFQQARQVLDQFDQSHLLLLLGQDYKKITEMKHLIADSGREQGISTASKSSGGSNHWTGSNHTMQSSSSADGASKLTAGVKRKQTSMSEVIDLTSD